MAQNIAITEKLPQRACQAPHQKWFSIDGNIQKACQSKSGRFIALIINDKGKQMIHNNHIRILDLFNIDSLKSDILKDLDLIESDSRESYAVMTSVL